MPKLLSARPPLDPTEEARVRQLARARHAPHDLKQRAQTIVLSWDGHRTMSIAEHLGCHPQTVRERFARFNAHGLEGLNTLPGAGRKPRLTQEERGRLITLVGRTPPGRAVRDASGELVAADAAKPALWTLDALVEVAREQGIIVGRSQVRRILQREGVRWRQPRSWATSPDADFIPKERRSLRPTPNAR